jgi:hypothetical protein
VSAVILDFAAWRASMRVAQMQMQMNRAVHVLARRANEHDAEKAKMTSWHTWTTRTRERIRLHAVHLATVLWLVVLTLLAVVLAFLALLMLVAIGTVLVNQSLKTVVLLATVLWSVADHVAGVAGCGAGVEENCDHNLESAGDFDIKAIALYALKSVHLRHHDVAAALLPVTNVIGAESSDDSDGDLLHQLDAGYLAEQKNKNAPAWEPTALPAGSVNARNSNRSVSPLVGSSKRRPNWRAAQNESLLS